MNQIADNDEGRKYFMFYRSFFDAIEKCDKDDQLALYRAIVMFGLNRKEPVFENKVLDLVWTLIRPNLNSSWIKCDNGKKSKGIPKPSMIGNKNAVKTKQKQNENKAETKQKQSNNRIRNNEYKYIEDKSSLSKTSTEVSDAVLKTDIDFDAFLKFWNDAANQSNLKKMCFWTDKRKTHLQARYQDCIRAKEGDCKEAKKMLFKVVENAKQSKWLNGEGLKYANFDWIFTHPNNFVKVLDGHYNS